MELSEEYCRDGHDFSEGSALIYLYFIKNRTFYKKSYMADIFYGGGKGVINLIQRRVVDLRSDNYLFKTIGIITKIFKL